MARTVLSTSGVRLPLHDLGGVGNPRTLLISHATGFHGRAYLPLVAAMHGFRVWAPDLRGHGDATPPDDLHFAWEGLADDIAAVVREIDDGAPLYAFGHSMGAAVCLLAEARRPGTFRAIYAFEPIVIPPDLPREPEGRRSVWIEGTRKRRRDFPSLEAAIENFSSKPPFSTFDRAALLAYLEHGFERLDGGALRIKMDPDNEARMYQMSPQHPTWDHLPEVRCPVVVASGRPQPNSASAWTGQIAARLPNARVEIWHDIGHMGPFEAPEAIGRAAQKFFDSVAASGPSVVEI